LRTDVLLGTSCKGRMHAHAGVLLGEGCRGGLLECARGYKYSTQRIQLTADSTRMSRGLVLMVC